MPLPLNPSEAHRLASAFLRTGAMRRRHTRDMFLGSLYREFGLVLPVTRYDEDLYDMAEIVNVCLAHPGAVHALVAVIERFHPDSTSVRDVRALVEELLPDPLLRPAERRELYQLAVSLERGALASGELAALSLLHREAVGPAGPAPERPVHGVRDLLAELEDLSFQDDGVPPLLKFVALLACRAHEPVAAELRAWLVRFAGRLGLPPPDVPAAPVREIAGDSAGRAYLVIECRPDSADPHGYLASAWLQYRDEPGASLLREDRPRPLEELPGLVEALLVGEPQVVNRYVPELTVEFVLPRHLLGVPVDQYLYAPRGLRRRLGIDYPVVVRSLERMRDPQLRRTWQGKWKWFARNPRGGCATWAESSGGQDDERLYAELCEQSNVCLALAFPPGGAPEPVDELEIGLQAGVPIVLWRREGGDADRFVTDISGFLSSDLMSLPQKVHELRAKAVRAGDPRHPGHHLTLLFEDADRLPEPYLRLQPPN